MDNHTTLINAAKKDDVSSVINILCADQKGDIDLLEKVNYCFLCASIAGCEPAVVRVIESYIFSKHEKELVKKLVVGTYG